MVSEKSEMFLDASCDLLGDGYPIRFCATGQSMKPTIKDGEVIIIEPVEPAKIERGDIIFYRAKRGVIAHRVMAIARTDGGQPTFILRGDSAVTDDPPVASSNILGRVIAVERRGRNINLSSHSAKRLAVIKVLLYKLRVRVVATLKPLLWS